MSSDVTPKSCIHCAESIQPDARKCRYCGEWQKPQLVSSSPSPPQTGGLQQLESLSRIVGVVLIPVVLAVVGNSFNSAVKKQDINVRMIETAVRILQSPPSDNTALREWAISLINHHADMPLSEMARQELLEHQLFPARFEGDAGREEFLDFLRLQVELWINAVNEEERASISDRIAKLVPDSSYLKFEVLRLLKALPERSTFTDKAKLRSFAEAAAVRLRDLVETHK